MTRNTKQYHVSYCGTDTQAVWRFTLEPHKHFTRRKYWASLAGIRGCGILSANDLPESTEISPKMPSQTLTSRLLALNSDPHSAELQHDGAWKLSRNLDMVSPNRCRRLSPSLLHFISLNTVSHRAAWGAELEVTFMVASFGSTQKEFLKSKKKTSWKNWLLVELSLPSWHHQSTNSVGDLSNPSSMRDKRNRQTPEKWRTAPQHSQSRWLLLGGNNLLGWGAGKERVFGGGGEPHQLKCAWFIIFSISQQNNFLPCLLHCAQLSQNSFFSCYSYFSWVFLNVFFLTVTVDRSSPVTIWLLK